MSESDIEVQPEEEIVTVQEQLDAARRDGIAEGRQQMAERSKVLLLSVHGLSDHNVHQAMLSLFDKELGLRDTLRVPKRAVQALSVLDQEVAARVPVMPEPESEEDYPVENSGEGQEAQDGGEPSPAAPEGADAA